MICCMLNICRCSNTMEDIHCELANRQKFPELKIIGIWKVTWGKFVLGLAFLFPNIHLLSPSQRLLS